MTDMLITGAVLIAMFGGYAAATLACPGLNIWPY